MSAAHYWPWPAWEEEACLAQRQVWQVLQGLPLTGVQASLRISAAGIETGRWVVGLDPQALASQCLTQLTEGWGFPKTQILEVLQAARQAHRIGVGLAQQGLECLRTLYLVHGMSQTHTLLPPGQPLAGPLVLEAYQQGARSGHALRRTAYGCLSGWSTGQMLCLLQSREEASAGWLAQALGAVLARQPRWPGPRLLHVQDAAGQMDAHFNRGMGLRFYGSGLLIADLDPLWATLAQAFDLGHRLERVLAPLSEVEIGWLHAGHDASGQAFLIVYAPLHERAWGVLRQGLPTLSNLRSKTGIES